METEINRVNEYHYPPLPHLKMDLLTSIMLQPEKYEVILNKIYFINFRYNSHGSHVQASQI